MVRRENFLAGSPLIKGVVILFYRIAGDFLTLRGCV